MEKPHKYDLEAAAEALKSLADWIEEDQPFATKEIEIIRQAADFAETHANPCPELEAPEPEPEIDAPCFACGDGFMYPDPDCPDCGGQGVIYKKAGR